MSQYFFFLPEGEPAARVLLFTDACDYGIGSVLSQMQDGSENQLLMLIDS